MGSRAMIGPGLAARPDGDRIDAAALRAERRARLFGVMRAAGLDALVLGRPGDVAFAVGGRTLFTTGSRPFWPGCVVVGDQLHVLADHDEGIPAEIPRANLFGRAWDPANAARRIAAVGGLAEARRIGVAGAGERVLELLARTAPAAELVDARPQVHAARSSKSPAEVVVIETACALAEAGLAAMDEALRPGVTTRELLGRHAERLGELGVTVIPDGSVARRGALGVSAGADDVGLAAGELVTLSPSVTYAGYDATLARTLPTGRAPDRDQARLRDRTVAAVGAVVEACRPGATGADLLAAWSGAGAAPFAAPLAHGLGMGIEEPVVGVGSGAAATLAAGMVLVVQGWLAEPSLGAWHHRDVVHLAPTGPRLLTRRRP